MDSFRTKRGRCVLTDDELRIETGLVPQIRRYWEGNKPLLAAYLLVYSILLVAAVNVVRGGNWDALAFGIGVVATLSATGWALGRRRGVRSDDHIPLHDVESVAAVAGDDWLTRPRLVVRYWRGGGVKRRYVMMPSGLLSYADAEFERAETLLRERGVPVEAVGPSERAS
ncbi:hypothetical protein BRC82_07000 [Halobacteriales archaeon QS_1_67_19]|nr:MAG: hypothetical protein BRC82_07000 [Halobacteriales archaeon QS_1_67_19]